VLSGEGPSRTLSEAAAPSQLLPCEGRALCKLPSVFFWIVRSSGPGHERITDNGLIRSIVTDALSQFWLQRDSSVSGECFASFNVE
jgi:hypothetical protein